MVIKIIKLLLLTFFCVVTFPANAWKIVYDPTNYVQNYIAASNGIKTELHTAEMMRQQIQETIHQGNAVRSLAGLSDLSGLQTEYTYYKQLKNVDSQMLQSISKSREMADDLMALYGASNLSWESFLKTRSDNANSRTNALIEQYRITNAEMTSVAQRRQDIVGKLQSATGQTQALQAVGAAIDVLIGQNQQLISVMTTQGNASISKTLEAEAARKASVYDANEYQQKLKKAAQNVKNL